MPANRVRWILFVIVIIVIGKNSAFSQAPKKPAPFVFPKEEIIKEETKLLDKLQELKSAASKLDTKEISSGLLADVKVYQKALEWLLWSKDYNHKDIFKKAHFAAEQGILRVKQLAKQEPSWLQNFGVTVPRGYLSKIDSSLQPYAVVYPKSYGKDLSTKYPLHILLHGRNDTLTEVGFLYDNRSDKSIPQDQEHIQLAVYGRGNNAYRWAGETDVFEAIETFLNQEKQLGRLKFVDLKRVVLKGFSMGGAGSWHLGLQHPDKWCVVGPGAGFVNTHGYIPNLPEKLPEPLESNLSIYDAFRYAQNAFNIPIVAYSGEIDKQKEAADIMEQKIKSLGIPMVHLVAPGLEHKFPPEWQKKAFDEYLPHIRKGIPDYPSEIRFETYTLKFPKCHWVQLDRLESHYRQSSIHATFKVSQFNVKTKNVRAFQIRLPDSPLRDFSFDIDGQKINSKAFPSKTKSISFERTEQGQWNSKLESGTGDQLAKKPGLQGPIDDAFTNGFICVIGSSNPWNEAPEKIAREELSRFGKEWKRYFRGELIIKKDIEVTESELKNQNIILFGDPGSNSLISKSLPKLPIQWTQKALQWRNTSVDSSSHLPALIYPSPFSPSNYVVLNSGHTFREADLKGTNALLYPRLGDYAILDLKNASKPLEIGLFDEYWKFHK